MKAFVKYTLMMELADGSTVEEFGKQMIDIAAPTSEAILDAITPIWLEICLHHGAVNYSSHYDALVQVEETR